MRGSVAQNLLAQRVMKVRRFLALTALIVAVGAFGGGVPVLWAHSGEGPAPDDDGDSEPPHMRPPDRGVQMLVGPIEVPAASEVTECNYLKLPSERDLAVNRVRIKVAGGSHHIHLYRPADPTTNFSDGHETCNFALDFEVWQLILASQSIYLDWKLPRGIAFHFRANEQLLAQTHFVNSGLLGTPGGHGYAMFNLHAIPPRKVKSYAGAFFGQDRDVVVPARSVSTATTRCWFPRPVKLLAMTGHYHFRGTRFTAASPDNPNKLLYDQVGYDDPAFVRYGKDTPEVPGLEWTCTYVNETDKTYSFGPFTDNNEHCNLFAFYYPTEGTEELMTCVQESGVSTVTVQSR